MDAEGNLLGDFLEQLGVKHTADYSARQFAAMPFKSLFGISKVLDSYGIGNEALRIDVRVKSLSCRFHFWLIRRLVSS